MKKVITKPVIALAFLAGVMGVSSVPLSASAHSGHNDWDNNNRWENDRHRWDDNRNNRHYRGDNDNRRRVSDWEARNIAQRLFPHRHIVGNENRWDHNGRMEHRFRFDDNHYVDVRDDGVIIRIFIVVLR